MAAYACGTCGREDARCKCLHDDFSKAPVSIGEARSKKTGLARDSSAREGLIEILRRIDSGEIKPDFIVIGWAQRIDGGAVDSGFKYAGNGNSAEYLGLSSRLWWHANS